MLDISGLANLLRYDAGANASAGDRHAHLSLLFELTWHCGNAVHTDCTFQQGLNLRQDVFPRQIEAVLINKTIGDRVAIDFEPGQLLALAEDADHIRLDSASFKAPAYKNVPIRPAVGRFYPRGFISGVKGIQRRDIAPMRITAADRQLEIDLNHPLAGRDLSLASTLVDVARSCEPGRGGLCEDIGDLVTRNGPGIQARWRNQPTDFWSGGPFERDDESPDGGFYAQPRFVGHVDATASWVIGELYRQWIPADAVLLDLMASWDSHLPGALTLSHLVGLGMNAQELARNERMDHYVIHDLNGDPCLPFEADSFDAVTCTVSVEYLTKPLEVFADVARVLKLGGRFIVTFSNRRFPPKAIRVWETLHDYERMGLVLEYFLNRGLFTELRTWSLRGLPRPSDDKYADRLPTSDPIFSVVGTREGVSN